MPDPAFNAKLEQMADEMLAVRACSGDSGAMALLTARMVPLVKTLAAKYGGGAMEPEDLHKKACWAFWPRFTAMMRKRRSVSLLCWRVHCKSYSVCCARRG